MAEGDSCPPRRFQRSCWTQRMNRGGKDCQQYFSWCFFIQLWVQSYVSPQTWSRLSRWLMLLLPSNGTFSIHERSQREQYCLRINCRQDLSTQIPQNDSHYTITWLSATKKHSTLFLHCFEGENAAALSSLSFKATAAQWPSYQRHWNYGGAQKRSVKSGEKQKIPHRGQI